MFDSGTVQVRSAIVFKVGTRLYGLEQRGTATLLPWLQRFSGASAAPGLPPWCLGLLNVRGTVQMAVDLAGLLGTGQPEVTAESRLIFIEHGPAQLGLLVDAEIGVRNVRCQDAPGRVVAGQFAARVGELDAQQVTVLDGAALIR